MLCSPDSTCDLTVLTKPRIIYLSPNYYMLQPFADGGCILGRPELCALLDVWQRLNKKWSTHWKTAPTGRNGCACNCQYPTKEALYKKQCKKTRHTRWLSTI